MTLAFLALVGSTFAEEFNIMGGATCAIYPTSADGYFMSQNSINT